MSDASASPPDRGFDIENLPPMDEDGGGESLDAGQAGRLRMHFLASQHASLVTQTQFADAKAAALMTLMGLVALNGPVRISQGVPDGDALVIFVLLFAAVGLAMWAIVPRYPDQKLSRLIKRRDRFSWPALVAAGYDPLDHARFMRGAEAAQLLMSIAQTNGAMARVLHRKFRFLRAAFVLAGVDLALIVAYVMGVRVLA